MDKVKISTGKTFKMKKMIWAPLIVSGFLFQLAASDFELVKDGRPQAAIVRPSDRNKEVDEAISFFNTEAEKCVGRKFDVLEAAPREKNSIVLHVRKASIPEDDFFAIDFPDKNTMQITCSDRSARWAFNHLLEKYFGVRWLFARNAHDSYEGEINHYPPVKNLAVPRKKFEKNSSFNLYRCVDFRFTGFEKNWNLKRSFTGIHCMVIDVFPVYKYALDQSWPGEILPVIKGEKYIPPKAKGPLSKNIWLARGNYCIGWQPCWSNPKTTGIAIENILEILAKNPDKHEINMDVNDCRGFCECPECLKAVKGKTNTIGCADYSELYWKWVNDVAAAVTRKYPNVYFTAIAYTEVTDPPGFKLCPNVIPRVCLELTAMLDPAVYAKRIKMFKKWGEKASLLAYYDYSYGASWYLFPHLYFGRHSELLKMLHANQFRSVFIESDAVNAFEGPKHYLFSKMLWDVNSDPEEIVMDWCNHAVGKKAAPFLRDYYRFWEEYWVRPEIEKTQWYNTLEQVYMQGGEKSTHTFALKVGDMEKCRKLMEKVVQHAGTPLEKKRAAIFMKNFELSESAAKALFSEIIQPDSTVASASDAVTLLKSVPEALVHIGKFKENPWNRHVTKDLLPFSVANLRLIMPYMNDKAVRAEIDKLLALPNLPPEMKGQFKLWLGAEAGNVISNGSFEEPSPLPTGWDGSKLPGSRSSDYASDGKYSIKSSYLMCEFTLPAKKPGTYFLMFDAFAPKTSVEGRLNYMFTLRTKKQNRNHTYYRDISLPANKWQTFTGMLYLPLEQSGKMIDNFQIHIYTRKFEPDCPVYIDHVRLYRLEDLK